MAYSLRVSSQRCTSVVRGCCSSLCSCIAIAVLFTASGNVQAGATLNSIERLDSDRTASQNSTPTADSSRAKETSWTEYWKDDSAPQAATEVPEPAFKPESTKATRNFDHGAPVLIPTPTALSTGTIGLLAVALLTQLRRVRRWFV